MPIFDREHADLVIALVDDDDDDRFIIKRTLDLVPQRLAIVEYTNAKLCLEDFCNPPKTGTQPAEMIVLDLNMPIMNGKEFLVEFRADRRFDNIPVVVLTTADDSETLQEVVELGANESMSKSSDWQGRGRLSQIIMDHWLTSMQASELA
ncbi:MAG: response regulator [Hyphomicrobiales bacterium]